MLCNFCHQSVVSEHGMQLVKTRPAVTFNGQKGHLSKQLYALLAERENVCAATALRLLM